jgi:hypothetical protein
VSGARPTPLSRRAGRAVGRAWRRVAPGVRSATAPARASWAGFAAAVWFAGYLWVGLLLATAADRLSGGRPSALSSAVAVAGGVSLGAWQGLWRLRRHRDGAATPPLRGVGPALAGWVGLVALAVVVQR